MCQQEAKKQTRKFDLMENEDMATTTTLFTFFDLFLSLKPTVHCSGQLTIDDLVAIFHHVP